MGPAEAAASFGRPTVNRRGAPLSDRAEGLLVVLLVVAYTASLAWFSVDEVQALPLADRSQATIFALSAWGLSLAAGLVLLAVHHRRGTLILRDPAEREANRRRIQQGNPRAMVVPMACAAVALGAFSPSVKLVVFGLFGGLGLVFAPHFLWIAITVTRR